MSNHKRWGHRQHNHKRKPKPSHVTSEIIVWEELVAHEPLLNKLLIVARGIKDEGIYFCRDQFWRSLPNKPGFRKFFADIGAPGTQARFFKPKRLGMSHAIPFCKRCHRAVTVGVLMPMAIEGWWKQPLES